jgi:hypothetical protein
MGVKEVGFVMRMILVVEWGMEKKMLMDLS